jgi:oxygen-independent coproporphyrinogen-3 oxidase
VGVSAIGDVAGAYAQNQKKLPRYYDAIDAGSLPIERGYRLSADDRLRRYVITQLMCNFHLDKRAVEERFGIAFDSVFERELAELSSPDGLIANGFVTASREALDVEPLGRLFVRNVAMLFDRYLLNKRTDAPIFSRTV